MTTAKDDSPIGVIKKAEALFLSKGWSIDEEKSFERFCSTLSILNKEQRDLYFKLTKRFLRIDGIEYKRRIPDLFYQLFTRFSDTINRFYIYPLLIKKDIENSEPKSSDDVYCAMKSNQYDLDGDIYKKLKFVGKPYQGLPANFNEKEGSMILLVDDFIGTGDTAISAVDYLCSEHKILVDKLTILSFVALRQGYLSLRDKGINLITNIVVNKGISDNYYGDVKATCITTMESIEDLINVKEKNRFGYKKSEALVKMEGTPNNTFPVYWIINEKLNFMGVFPR